MTALSDTPNFSNKRHCRNRALKMLLVAAGVVAGVAAWCLSADDPAQEISVVTTATSAKIGSPYSVEATISNAGTRTAQIHLQLALFIKQSECIEAGKRLPNSFSLPMNLSVSPNGSQTVVMQFGAVTSPCHGVAGVEVFADGKMDLERFSLNRKLESPEINLL
jgi:hypothetical protein